MSARVAALDRSENTRLKTRTGCCAKSSTSISVITSAVSAMKVWTNTNWNCCCKVCPMSSRYRRQRAKTTTATRHGAAHPVRRMLAEDKLETHETVIEPEEVQAQPEGWKKISEERTSQLDWVAPKIIKRVLIRPRYVKAERFAIAPLPPQPIEQGMVGPGLLAQILVSKYEYHQPLYRQEKMFRQQFGVELSRKTMGCWVEQAAELLKPVYRSIREDLLRGNYLQADETPIRYLDPDVKGKSQQGYLWAYSRPGGDVLFEWRVSRSREGPEEFLKNFRGKLQTDGYAAYESLAKERGDLTLIGCWAHARRGFHEALAETKLAAWFVRQIGLLYAVEKKLREQKAGPALRQAMRVWQGATRIGIGCTAPWS